LLLCSLYYGLIPKIAISEVEGASSGEAAAGTSDFSRFPAAGTLGGPSSLIRLTRRDYGAMQSVLSGKFSRAADDPNYARRGRLCATRRWLPQVSPRLVILDRTSLHVFTVGGFLPGVPLGVHRFESRLYFWRSAYFRASLKCAANFRHDLNYALRYLERVSFSLSKRVTLQNTHCAFWSVSKVLWGKDTRSK